MDGQIDRCINGAVTRMTILCIKHSALVASEVQSGGGVWSVHLPCAWVIGLLEESRHRVNLCSASSGFSTLCCHFLIPRVCLSKSYSPHHTKSVGSDSSGEKMGHWMLFHLFRSVCVLFVCFFFVNTRQQESTLKQEKLLVFNKCFLFLIHLNHCSWTRE